MLQPYGRVHIFRDEIRVLSVMCTFRDPECTRGQTRVGADSWASNFNGCRDRISAQYTVHLGRLEMVMLSGAFRDGVWQALPPETELPRWAVVPLRPDGLEQAVDEEGFFLTAGEVAGVSASVPDSRRQAGCGRVILQWLDLANGDSDLSHHRAAPPAPLARPRVRPRPDIPATRQWTSPMDHFKTLTIRNFRGMRHRHVPRLARLNLIVDTEGGNGKTTLLEAVSALARRGQPHIGACRVFVQAPMGVEHAHMWPRLFRDGNRDTPIELSARHGRWGGMDLKLECDPPELRFRYSDSTTPPHGGRGTGTIVSIPPGKGFKYSASLHIDRAPFAFAGHGDDVLQPTVTAERHLMLEGRGETDWLLSALARLDPHVESLSLDGASPRNLWVRFRNGQSLPLFASGQRLWGWTRMLHALAAGRGGTVCLDGLPDLFPQASGNTLWRVLLEGALHWDVQVFATSHAMPEAGSFAASLHAEGNLGLVRLDRDTPPTPD